MDDPSHISACLWSIGTVAISDTLRQVLSPHRSIVAHCLEDQLICTLFCLALSIFQALRIALWSQVKRYLSSLVWEDLSIGEKIAVLYAVLQEHADQKAAASFLASIEDPIIQESNTKAGAQVSWKYVKAAFEEISSSWSDLNAKLSSAEEAHLLVIHCF